MTHQILITGHSAESYAAVRAGEVFQRDAGILGLGLILTILTRLISPSPPRTRRAPRSWCPRSQHADSMLAIRSYTHTVGAGNALIQADELVDVHFSERVRQLRPHLGNFVPQGCQLYTIPRRVPYAT